MAIEADGPTVLFDGRLGPDLTGIGRYTHELTRQFAVLAPHRVRPLCWRSQVATLRALGLRPVVEVAGRAARPWLLPRSDVAHGPNFQILQTRLARSVITVHDTAWERLPHMYPDGVRRELRAALERARQADALAVCDSDVTRRDLVQLCGYPAERTRVVHLGVDAVYATAMPGDDAVAARYGLTRPYLLHTGAWVPRKNIPALLEAWALTDRRDDLDLVLAGDRAAGWLSDGDRIDAWLEQHHSLASRVRVLGHVPEADLPAITRRAAAAVSSSLWEGFGLTILQAMAGGVPVAAFRGGSLPEIAGGHVAFSAGEEPGSLAEAIDVALAMPADARRAAAEHAIAFTWERCARETLTAYADAWTRRARPEADHGRGAASEPLPEPLDLP
jgi:glycosyltransferase involved in cell wall biosynthesis